MKHLRKLDRLKPIVRAFLYVESQIVPSLLFCWELGNGWGHLAPYAQAMSNLVERGWTIHAVVREPRKVPSAWPNVPVVLWQAPVALGRAERPFSPTRTFPQVLHNAGFERSGDVASRVMAWDSIIRAIRPDHALVNYAPTALLALRGQKIPITLCGTGFFIPPDVSTSIELVPASRPNTPGSNPETLVQTDDRLLEMANQILELRNSPKLERFSQLFHDVSKQCLTTVPELDHYPQRTSGNYVGLPLIPSGSPPEWPAGSRRRVFCYLKPAPAVEFLLQSLHKLQLPTIVYGDGLPVEFAQRYSHGSMTFSQSPVDLQAVGRECYLAVTNGNHATTLQMLQAGKPLLIVPLHLEQELIGRRVVQLGAGLMVGSGDNRGLFEALNRMLEETQFAQNAFEYSRRLATRPRQKFSEQILSGL